jgi:cysteinyl-tRNA synthetase
VQELVDQRQAARVAKDFALADELRDRITAAGWSVEDAAGVAAVRPL